MAKTVEKKEISKVKGGKQLVGVVVSDKMKDTVVVEVTNFKKHPKYLKYLKISKNIKAHDVGNTKKVGDKVTIKECKPVSKQKHFVIV